MTNRHEPLVIGQGRMRSPRAMVPIPAQLSACIDRIAGEGKRSAFIVELLNREIRRRKQIGALEMAAGSWKDKDHPELPEGSDVWVRKCATRPQSVSRRRMVLPDPAGRHTEQDPAFYRL